MYFVCLTRLCARVGGVINFDDINYDVNYSAMAAYGQSKLANILFSKVLAEKLKGKLPWNVF